MDARQLIRVWDVTTGEPISEAFPGVTRALVGEEGGRVVFSTGTTLEGTSVDEIGTRALYRSMAPGDALLAIDGDGQRAAIAPEGA